LNFNQWEKNRWRLVQGMPIAAVTSEDGVSPIKDDDLLLKFLTSGKLPAGLSLDNNT